jgi:hypothetical protein
MCIMKRAARSTLIWLVLGAAMGYGASRAVAQDTPAATDPQPRLMFKWYSFDGNDGITQSVAARSARLQMAGMQAGFITNGLGIDPDDDPSGTPPSVSTDSDRDVIQFNIGTYNPYFDLRLPGDPGTLGYYKLHSQLQLLDAGSTSFCLNLEAYTPAGQQVGGLANGPTYLIPTLACFQDLGFGAALQGFLGQNIQANSHWTDLSPNLQYGLAIHCAVPGMTTTRDQGLYVYMEALGRYRTDPTQPTGHTAIWEFVPGVQMRVNNNCWMSLGASRYNFLSCSWKY